MESPDDLPITLWDHEPEMHKSLEINETIPRFMERLDSTSCQPVPSDDSQEEKASAIGEMCRPHCGDLSMVLLAC